MAEAVRWVDRYARQWIDSLASPPVLEYKEILMLDELISGRCRLDQINEAYTDLLKGSAKHGVLDGAN